MLTEGANLEEFKKNPVMLYSHNDFSRPIGRWENIRKEGGKILADAVFDMEDERENGGAAIASQVERDFIRSASIGAWPPDMISDDEKLKLPEQQGPTVTKWTVREASIVTIGSNHSSLVMYDRHTGEKINLEDGQSIIKLMDSRQTNQNKAMKGLNQILNLSDNATEDEVTQAVRGIITERDKLKEKNTELSDKLKKLDDEAKQHQKNEAVKLIDAAVKDGRLNAEAKDTFIKLFDADFESAKNTLENIPKRESVTQKIEQGKQNNNAELADLQKKSWDELDKQDKLVTLKDKFPEVYEQKFEEKFGTKPTKSE